MSNIAITWAYTQHTKWGAGCKAVLVALADMADENHSCYPGQELLGAMTDQDVRSVRRQVDRLVELGLVTVEERYNAGGRTSDRYTLAVDPETPSRRPDRKAPRTKRTRQPKAEADTMSATPSPKPVPDTVSAVPDTVSPVPDSVSGEPKEEPLVEPTVSRSSAKSATRDAGGGEPRPTHAALFDQFWEVYPRKVAKGAAQTKFAAALKKAPAEEIIDGARRYRDDPNREDEFTAHPTTWLSQGRWTDDPLPERRSEQRTHPDPNPANRRPQW